MLKTAPRAVAELLVGALPELRDRLRTARMRQAWRAIVGPEMANRAQPREFVDGCLHVVVNNSPWLHELTLRAAELTARLNRDFAEIRSVRFTLGALPAEAPPGAGQASPRARALSVADTREIDACVMAISDAPARAAARRLLTTARRFPVR